jgi:hypothetical protein
MSSKDEFTLLYESVIPPVPSSKKQRRHLTFQERESALRRIRYCIIPSGIKTPVIISPDKDSQEDATESIIEWFDILFGSLEIPVDHATEFLEEYVDTVVSDWLKAKIEPGTNTGTSAVEAFANPISQANFNTFHTAGFSKNTARAIDSFRQAFEASKSKKTYQAVIKFYQRYTIEAIVIDKVRELVSVYASNVLRNVEPISISGEMFADTSGGSGKIVPSWLAPFRRIYAKKIPPNVWNSLDAALLGQPSELEYALYAELNLTVMYRHKITMNDVVKRITKHKDCYVIYSPPIDDPEIPRIEIYILPDVKEIKNVKAYEKVKGVISNKDLQLLYFYNTKIPDLAQTLIKGIAGIDVVIPRDIPIINAIYHYELVSNLLGDARLKSSNLAPDTVVIKYNQKYMIKNSITEDDILKLLKVLGVQVVDTNILGTYSEFKGYNLLVTYDMKTNAADIIKVNGDVKDKVPFITVGDILRYRLKGISTDKKAYTKLQREVRKKESKRPGKFVRLYRPETELEYLSVIRLAETYGAKKDKTDPQIARKEKSPLMRLFRLEDVDPYGCYSDDIYEMGGIFGVESCRHVLRGMFDDLIRQSDFVINTRHIGLICDFMTRSGFITSISEKGMAYHHMGPTAQFAYTQPSKYIKKATLYGAEDELENASSRITTGRRIKSGTSVVDIQPDPTREAQLLKEIRSKKLTFDTSQTSTLINQLMNITSGSTAEAATIKLVLPTARVIAPTEIKVTELPGILEGDIIDMTDLDPIIPKENIQAAGELGVQPLECRPAVESEGVTINLDRVGIPATESITAPVPYVTTSQPPPLDLSEPTGLSIVPASNPDLDYLF